MADEAAQRKQIGDAAEKFKSRLNSRATKPPQTPEAALKALRSARKPVLLAFIFLGIIAVVFDVLDFFETFGDATVLLFFVQMALELAFFILVRSLLNRGAGTSIVIMVGSLFLLVVGIVPIIGQIVMLVFGVPILCLGIFNKNAKVIQVGQTDLLANIQQLEQGAQIARQTAARLIRAGRSSPRLAKATQAIVRSKAVRSFTKGSKVVTRLAAFTGGEIIPGIEFIPFHLIGIYLTYRDQKRIYEESRQLIAEYEQLYSELQGMDSAIVQEQMAGFVAQTQTWQAERSPQPQRQVGQEVRDVSVSGAPPPRIPQRAPEATPSTRPPIRDINPAATVPVAA